MALVGHWKGQRGERKPELLHRHAYCPANRGHRGALRRELWSEAVLYWVDVCSGVPKRNGAIWSVDCGLRNSSDGIYYTGTDNCAVFGVVCPDDVAVIVLNPQSGRYAGVFTGWYGKLSHFRIS